MAERWCWEKFLPTAGAKLVLAAVWPGYTEVCFVIDVRHLLPHVPAFANTPNDQIRTEARDIQERFGDTVDAALYPLWTNYWLDTWVAWTTDTEVGDWVEEALSLKDPAGWL